MPDINWDEFDARTGALLYPIAVRETQFELLPPEERQIAPHPTVVLVPSRNNWSALFDNASYSLSVEGLVNFTVSKKMHRLPNGHCKYTVVVEWPGAYDPVARRAIERYERYLAEWRRLRVPEPAPEQAEAKKAEPGARFDIPVDAVIQDEIDELIEWLDEPLDPRDYQRVDDDLRFAPIRVLDDVVVENVPPILPNPPEPDNGEP